MKSPFLIGLTGSIGMGKSTTAKMFADHDGVVVWDADAAVHRLYGPGGAAVAPMRALRPEAIVNNAIDRTALKAWIAEDMTALKHIEALVHPLVSADRAQFLQTTEAQICVLDIPLLFELGSEAQMDLVVVVSAPAEVQRARVLDRPGMTEAQLGTILAKQVPDAEKRRRADVVIETIDIDAAREAVNAVVKDVKEGRYA